jgi:hypothetical protein
MDPAEFKRVLDLGLGRAVLYLREHVATSYHAAIAHACGHNTAYDAQVEGSRAEYLFDVLQATGKPDEYLDEILAALAAVTKHWDADQLFDTALRFAQSDHARARDAMYEKFFRNEVDEPFTGADALVRLGPVPIKGIPLRGGL